MANDFDKRFRELIAEEYGDTSVPELPELGQKHCHRSEPEWFSMDEALENVELDPLSESDRWRPTPKPLNLRLPKRAKYAAGLFVVAICLGVLLFAGVLPYGWWIACLVVFGAGMLLVLSLIPRSGNPYDSDDGAVL